MKMSPDELAAIEEARMVRTFSELGDEQLLIGGGVACWGGTAESWMNLVTGLGMRGPLEADAIARIDAFYAGRTEPAIEVCPFADDSVLTACAAGGFHLAKFETVLYRDLETIPTAPVPEGYAFEAVAPDDGAAVDAFIETHVASFSPGGGPHADAMASGARRMLAHPRTTAWVVRCAGEVVGAAALEHHRRLATLMAGCVLEPHRERGLQQALIALRCEAARGLGCEVVTIGSRPWSVTGRNALRLGFVTAYTRAILQRPPTR